MARTSDDSYREPEINVAMDGGRVVIRPAGRLDPDGMDTMRGLLAGARAAGVSPVLDLSLIDRREHADVLNALGCSVAVLPLVPAA